MPTEIHNRNVYLSLMRRSFYDKAWFMKNLPTDVKTIIDFGGGSGEFAGFCQNITGDQVNYIVIDNDPKFLSIADSKFETFESLDLAMKNNAFNPKTTLLVLSSVIHEVYSYADVKTFWNDVQTAKCKYIAIRDMTYDYDSTSGFNLGLNDFKLYKMAQLIRSRLEAICPEKLKMFEETKIGIFNQKILDVDVKRPNLKNLLHFMLKYRYDENFEREVKENYMPLSNIELVCKLHQLGYDTSSKLTKLKFLIDTWLKELKLENPKDEIECAAVAWIRGINTHLKCFGTLN